MRVLLDSHTVIWAVDDPGRLGADATAVVEDGGNDLLISAATIWETSIKFGLGKLVLSDSFREWMSGAIRALDLAVLPIEIDYADTQCGLPNHHRDPFDRLLIAQAIVEDLPIVSADSAFDAYGVTRIW